MTYTDEQVASFLRRMGVETDLGRILFLGLDEPMYAIRNYARQYDVRAEQVEESLRWPMGAFITWLSRNIVSGMGDMTTKTWRTDAEAAAEYAAQPDVFAFSTRPHCAVAHATARRWSIAQLEFNAGISAGRVSQFLVDKGLTWERP